MFDISTTLATGVTLINSYGQGGFTVAGTRYEGAICVTESEILPISIASASDFGEFLGPFLAGLTPAPEIVIVGTGKAHEFIALSIRKSVKDTYNISLDSMDTGAACRTFNVLTSEARKVAAILLPI